MEYRDELSVRITGQAGQGIETIGEALARLFKDAGFHIFANRDFMSRIRGGNNYVQLRISDRPVRSPRSKPDIIFCLDGDSVGLHMPSLSGDGVLIADAKKFDLHVPGRQFFDLPMYDIAVKVGGSALFVNTAALGVLAGLTDRPFPQVKDVIKDTFRKKSEEIIEKNTGVALAAYDFARDNRDRFTRFEFNVPAQVPGEKQLFINGHDAVAIGAIKAGCKFYTGYPMTPSTAILELMARFGPRYNILVEQAEDEISAVNMAIGASYAGVRAMTATSGGGFALMTEGLALAAMTETPIVICVGMRPGPATGFPTRTSQDTLNFVLHAGHGEFTRAVYTPGTVEQAFRLTVKAFDTADRYQLPAIILTDQHFADSYVNMPRFDTWRVQPRRYVLPKMRDIENYRRYEFTGDGVSPRAVPSWIEGVVYADSDEHNQEGHITEDEDIGRMMVEKRVYRKYELLAAEIEPPEAYNTENADAVLVGFGSTYGVIKDVSHIVEAGKIGYIHLSQVWPFPSKTIVDLLSTTRLIFTVENNAEAQLAQLLFRETGIEADNSIIKYDGRPFTMDEVIEQLDIALAEETPEARTVTPMQTEEL